VQGRSAKNPKRLEKAAMWAFFAGILLFIAIQVIEMLARSGVWHAPAGIERYSLVLMSVAVWAALVMGAAARFGKPEILGAFALGGMVAAYAVCGLFQSAVLARRMFFVENGLACAILVLAGVSAASKRPFFVFEVTWWPLVLAVIIVLLALFATSFIRRAVDAERRLGEDAYEGRAGGDMQSRPAVAHRVSIYSRSIGVGKADFHKEAGG